MEEGIDQKTQLTWHTVRCLLEAHYMYLQLIFYWCYFRQDAHLLWPSVSSPRKWEHLIIWSLWSFSFLKLTSRFAFNRGRPGTSKWFISIHQIRDILISLQLWRSSSLDMHTLDRSQEPHSQEDPPVDTCQQSGCVLWTEPHRGYTPCEMWGPLASLYCCRLLVWSPSKTPEAKIGKSAVCTRTDKIKSRQ